MERRTIGSLQYFFKKILLSRFFHARRWWTLCHHDLIILMHFLTSFDSLIEPLLDNNQVVNVTNISYHLCSGRMVTSDRSTPIMVVIIVAGLPALHASHDPQSGDSPEGNHTDHCREICHLSVRVPRFDFHLQERMTIGHSVHRIPMARWGVSTTSHTQPCERFQLLYRRMRGSLVQVWAVSNKSSSLSTMSEMYLTWASATGGVYPLSSSHRASIVELGLNIRLA